MFGNNKNANTTDTRDVVHDTDILAPRKGYVPGQTGGFITTPVIGGRPAPPAPSDPIAAAAAKATLAQLSKATK